MWPASPLISDALNFIKSHGFGFPIKPMMYGVTCYYCKSTKFRDRFNFLMDMNKYNSRSVCDVILISFWCVCSINCIIFWVGVQYFFFQSGIYLFIYDMLEGHFWLIKFTINSKFISSPWYVLFSLSSYIIELLST